MALTKPMLEKKLKREEAQPVVESMIPIPGGTNPFQFDLDRMGTKVHDRFLVMYHSNQPNVLVIVDIKTGARTSLTYK